MSTATRHFSSSFVLIIAGERVSEEAKQSKAKRGKQASKQAASQRAAKGSPQEPRISSRPALM
jgi:hypothetical protein